MGNQPNPPSPQAITSEATGAAQAQLPISSAGQQSSQYNQSNPYGGLQYVQTGTTPQGTPIWSVNTSFSPTQQNLYNQYTGTQTQAGSYAPSTLGFGNYGTVSPTQQIGSMTSGTTGQLENSYLQSVEPFFNNQYNQLYTQLVNQGFTPNSPAAPATPGQYNPAAGDPAYNNAMLQLQTAQDNAALGAAAQFEPSAFNQAQQLYQLPLTTSEQLAQWGAPQSPTNMFTNQTPAFATPSISQNLGAETTAAMNQYQAQQAQYNAMMQGLFGIGSAALGGLTGGLSLPFTSGLNPFVSSPSWGGGNAWTGDAYGGSASDPLSGLTAADYG